MKKSVLIGIIVLAAFIAGIVFGVVLSMPNNNDGTTTTTRQTTTTTKKTTTTTKKTTTTTKKTTTTATTKKTPNVEFISDRTIYYEDDGGYHCFCFALLDEDQNYLKVAATVKIRIVNDLGVEVYNKTVKVTSSNYSTWTDGVVRASIYIYDNEIVPGATEDGKFYYQVTASDGSQFSEYSLDVDDLPIKKTTVIIPSLPVTVNSSKTSTKIINVTYELNTSSITLKITGEKLYDCDGVNYSRACAVRYKVYDSEGYIVDSGIYYTDALKVGDKFKNDEETIYFDVVPGETYTIEFIGVD